MAPADYRERVFVVGANGTGKSYFSGELLTASPRWFAIDLKGDFGEDVGLEKRAKVITSYHSSYLKLFPRWVPRIIYRPKFVEYGRVDPLIGYLFDRARGLKKRYGRDHAYRFHLYCDETLLQSRGRKTTNLAGVAIAGRSVGMGLIAASQRLAWIPVEVRSEYWRMYVFYLSSREEEIEVVKLSKGRVTPDDLEALGADYSFYELKRQQGGSISVVHFPPMHYQPAGTRRTS